MGYKRGDFYECEYDIELMLKTREIEINKTLKKEEIKKENKQKKVANKKEVDYSKEWINSVTTVITNPCLFVNKTLTKDVELFKQRRKGIASSGGWWVKERMFNSYYWWYAR